MLPARFELAIFGLLLEFQAHTDYETDALPTEPRKHYGDVKGIVSPSSKGRAVNFLCLERAFGSLRMCVCMFMCETVRGSGTG